MNRRDLRSVGELLQSADLATRHLLMDVQGDDAPDLLRTWGEVVQSAAELWEALPPPTRHQDGVGALTRLEVIAQGMHRAQLRRGWPGEGPTDERLLQVAETFTRAADLVTSRQRPTRPDRAAVRNDIASARVRIMHTLYIASHVVAVAVRQHVHDRKGNSQGVKAERLTRDSPHGQDLLHRLSSFEQLAGAYVAGRYAKALQGEAVPPPPGHGRLSMALVGWDVQAHRTLAGSPTPANLRMVAHTQATMSKATEVMLQAGAVTGHIDPETFRQRLSPGLEASQASWTRMASEWNDLIGPTTRRTDPELVTARNEMLGAMLQITHDKTQLTSPEEMAARVDMAAAAKTLHQGLAAAVETSFVMRDIAADDPSLAGPARTIARRLSVEADEVSGLAAPVDVGDVHANRMIPLPQPLRDALVVVAEATVRATNLAVSTASDLDRPVAAAPPEGRSIGPGRQATARQIQTVLPIPAPGPTR